LPIKAILHQNGNGLQVGKTGGEGGGDKESVHKTKQIIE